MTNNKLVMGLSTVALATIMAAAVGGSVFAATGDLYKGTTTDLGSVGQVLLTNKAAIFDMITNLDSYNYEVSGNLYNATKVNALFNASPAASASTVQSNIVSTLPIIAPVTVSSALAVSSVSAINNTSIDVTITAPTADMLGTTIVVKDNNGNTVAVKPVDIAAGDTTASFQFVTPVTGTMTGTWTVAGVSVNFDQMAKLATVYNATTQLGLFNGLTALGVNNLSAANVGAYQTALTTLETTVTDVNNFTTVMAQNLVDTANASAITGTQAATVVKAVQDAQTALNQVTLLEALQNSAFTKVNADFIADYATGIATTDTTIAEIQTKINSVNDTDIKSQITTLGAASVDATKLNALNTLISSYATVDANGVITDLTIKAEPALINTQLSIVNVLAATTPTNLKSKLTALATLVNTSSTTTLDMTKYVDASGKDYITAIAGISGTVTATNINAAILSVNSAAAGSLVGAVKTAATTVGTTDNKTNEDALLTALNNLGLTEVATTNEAQYVSDHAAFVIASTTPNVEADVQVQVNISNIAAIKGQITDADALVAALNVIQLKNVNAANEDAYLASNNVALGADGTDISASTTVANMQNAVDAVNTSVSNAVQVKAINAATDATGVDSALSALGLDDYLNVPSADRMFVAQAMLDARNLITTGTAGQFADLSAVTTALGTPTTPSSVLKAYTDDLAGVNAFTSTTAITDATTALKLVGDTTFNAMTSAQQATISEDFLNSCDFTNTTTPGALKTSFKTLASVMALMK